MIVMIIALIKVINDENHRNENDDGNEDIDHHMVMIFRIS